MLIRAIRPDNRVVSIWEILKFHAYRFVAIMNSLSKLKGVSDALASTKVGVVADRSDMPQSQVDFSLAVLQSMRVDCEGSLLHISVDQIDRMAGYLKSRPVSWREYIELQSDLTRRIEDELKRGTFYQIRPEKVPFYESGDLLGEAVTERFPDIDHDLREAFRCYACERYDACCYHLMLAMERVLHALAASIGVMYAPNWDAYLKPINGWLAKVDRTKPDQRKKEAFLSESAALLTAVKIAWRNPGLHVGSRYGESQTREMLDSVSAFVRTLAVNWVN